MDAAFGHWFAGFADGEGTFCISHHKPSSRLRTPAYSFVFRLKVRDDDSDIIKEIHDRLGFGRVERVAARHHSNGQIGFVCSSLPDALSLINVLDAHPLRAKKRRDYAIWRAAALYAVAHPSINTSKGSWGPGLISADAEHNLRRSAVLQRYKEELEHARTYS